MHDCSRPNTADGVRLSLIPLVTGKQLRRRQVNLHAVIADKLTRAKGLRGLDKKRHYGVLLAMEGARSSGLRRVAF